LRGGEGGPEPVPDRGRADRDRASSFARIIGALGEFVSREISTADERSAAAPEKVRLWLEERSGALDAIRARLLSRDPVAWEVDVGSGLRAPTPYLLGHVRLQRVLIARALIDGHAEETDSALLWMEASWRLNEALTSRPELISHMVSAAISRLQNGALRKIDAPSFAWADRLRSRDLVAGMLAALHDGVWLLPSHDGEPAEDYVPGRVLHRFLAGLSSDDLCAWTPERLVREARDAAEGETPPNRVIGKMELESAVEQLVRYPRLRLEAELTALVLDARAERAASRRRAWPAKLLLLDSEVCPDRRWTYRVNPDATITIALEGPFPEAKESGVRRPRAFTAGVPAPPPKRPLTRSTPARTLPSE
jgi:hypothetical protein